MSSHGYLEVKNWDQFQHYKKRSPPWIKLHAVVLDNYEFSRLQDASKAHLMGIWILASKHGNKVPADPEWIAHRIGATGPVELEPLISAGFIARLRRASDPLPERKQSAPPETEGEAETEPEERTTTSASRVNGDTTDGQIMAAIRDHLYRPDGKPPEGWEEGREFSIMRALRKLGKSGSQILAVVEGLGCLLRDERVDWLKGKATLRAVYNSKTGVLDMWGQAEDAYYSQGQTFAKKAHNPKRPEDIRAAIHLELAKAKRGA